MTSLLVQASHLSRHYSDGYHQNTVLRDVSLEIAVGECVALLGESGSGKSTLLNLLGGIDFPDGGELMVAGRRVDTMREPELTVFRREHIGFVYQFFNLIPTLTVQENIDLPLELLGVEIAQRKQQIEEWLGRVGLAERGHSFPDQLSGGEQQRVAIARALVTEPKLVLADEPTGNLDANTGRLVLDMLTSLARDEGRSLLLVTHSREVAARADRVLEIRDGCVVAGDATPAW